MKISKIHSHSLSTTRTAQDTVVAGYLMIIIPFLWASNKLGECAFWSSAVCDLVGPFVEPPGRRFTKWNSANIHTTYIVLFQWSASRTWDVFNDRRERVARARDRTLFASLCDGMRRVNRHICIYGWMDRAHAFEPRAADDDGMRRVWERSRILRWNKNKKWINKWIDSSDKVECATNIFSPIPVLTLHVIQLMLTLDFNFFSAVVKSAMNDDNVWCFNDIVIKYSSILAMTIYTSAIFCVIAITNIIIIVRCESTWISIFAFFSYSLSQSIDTFNFMSEYDSCRAPTMKPINLDTFICSSRIMYPLSSSVLWMRNSPATTRQSCLPCVYRFVFVRESVDCGHRLIQTSLLDIGIQIELQQQQHQRRMTARRVLTKTCLEFAAFSIRTLDNMKRDRRRGAKRSERNDDGKRKKWGNCWYAAVNKRGNGKVHSIHNSKYDG